MNSQMNETPVRKWVGGQGRSLASDTGQTPLMSGWMGGQTDEWMGSQTDKRDPDQEAFCGQGPEETETGKSLMDERMDRQMDGQTHGQTRPLSGSGTMGWGGWGSPPAPCNPSSCHGWTDCTVASPSGSCFGVQEGRVGSGCRDGERGGGHSHLPEHYPGWIEHTAQGPL